MSVESVAKAVQELANTGRLSPDTSKALDEVVGADVYGNKVKASSASKASSTSKGSKR